MHRVRVLQLGSPTGMYGAERWILALIRHLNAASIESIVSAIRDDASYAVKAPLCVHAAELGFRVHTFDALGKANWSAVSQLREFIRVNDIDIVHSHGYKTDIIGLLATRGTDCRLVTTPHGWSVRAGVALRAYELLDRCLFPFCAAVVPLSDDLMKELKRWPGVSKRLHLIRNGVDISEVDAAVAVEPQVQAWKDSGAYIIGYIGQLIARKGLDVLIEAFAQLDGNKRLVLVGEGPQRGELEELCRRVGVADRVSFMGFRNDRLSILRGFDVFALPSRLEGIPRCLMEALAARVAVVASDIPGCRDLIKHESTGLLFEMDNVGALLGTLQQMRDEATRAAFVRKGREVVLAEYSGASMAQQYEMLYRKLCAPNPALQTI